jgi:hypothetical protein
LFGVENPDWRLVPSTCIRIHSKAKFDFDTTLEDHLLCNYFNHLGVIERAYETDLSGYPHDGSISPDRK